MKNIWFKIRRVYEKISESRIIKRDKKEEKAVTRSLLSFDKVVLFNILKYTDVKTLTYPISKLWVKLTRELPYYSLLQSQNIQEIWEKSILTCNHIMFDYAWSFIKTLSNEYKLSFLDKATILLVKTGQWSKLSMLTKISPFDISHAAGVLNRKDLCIKYSHIPCDLTKYIDGLFEGGHLNTILSLGIEEQSIIDNSLVKLIGKSSRRGHVHILEHVSSRVTCPNLINHIFMLGRVYNHPSIINYALNKGADISVKICPYEATMAGNLELLVQLYRDNPPSNKHYCSISSYSVVYGHINILKWSLDSIRFPLSCSVISNLIKYARMNRHLHIVKFIHGYIVEHPEKTDTGHIFSSLKQIF